MQFNFLFSLFLLFINVYPQTDLKAQYCALKTNTTGQIIVGINQAPQIRTSTEIILKSQSYTLNGATISLSFIEDQGSLFIEETDSDINTNIHKDNTDNILIYIDSLNQYILAKEITDPSTGQFDYVLFVAQIGKSGNMMKYSFNSKIDLNSNDISEMSLTKMIQIKSEGVYAVLTGLTQTSLYILSETNGGKLKYFSSLSNTNALDISGRNLKNLYESTTNTFYEKSSSQPVLYMTKTLNQLGIDLFFSGSNTKFTYLEDSFIAYQEKNGVLNILPIDSSTIDSNQVLSINGEYQIFTDNYKNFLTVTPYDLIWLRMTDQGLVSRKLSTTSLDTAIKFQILSILNQAQSVSFNSNSAVVIKRETSKKKGSLYSIIFDPTASQQFQIVDEYINSFNYMDKTLRKTISPSAVSSYQSSFGCNCIRPKIQKIECYAAALKCISITGPEREICTKSL